MQQNVIMIIGEQKSVCPFQIVLDRHLCQTSDTLNNFFRIHSIGWQYFGFSQFLAWPGDEVNRDDGWWTPRERTCQPLAPTWHNSCTSASSTSPTRHSKRATEYLLWTSPFSEQFEVLSGHKFEVVATIKTSCLVCKWEAQRMISKEFTLSEFLQLACQFALILKLKSGV